MDAKMERVIELTARLQEAVAECEDVISVLISASVDGGVHVYKPKTLGLGPMKHYYTDGHGYLWVRCDLGGVNVFGKTDEIESEGEGNQ